MTYEPDCFLVLSVWYMWTDTYFYVYGKNFNNCAENIKCHDTKLSSLGLVKRCLGYLHPWVGLVTYMTTGMNHRVLRRWRIYWPPKLRTFGCFLLICRNFCHKHAVWPWRCSFSTLVFNVMCSLTCEYHWRKGSKHKEHDAKIEQTKVVKHMGSVISNTIIYESNQNANNHVDW